MFRNQPNLSKKSEQFFGTWFRNTQWPLRYVAVSWRAILDRKWRDQTRQRRSPFGPSKNDYGLPHQIGQNPHSVSVTASAVDRNGLAPGGEVQKEKCTDGARATRPRGRINGSSLNHVTTSDHIAIYDQSTTRVPYASSIASSNEGGRPTAMGANS